MKSVTWLLGLLFFGVTAARLTLRYCELSGERSARASVRISGWLPILCSKGIAQNGRCP